MLIFMNIFTLVVQVTLGYRTTRVIEETKNSILELLNSKKETDDLIHTLVSDSENKEALLAARKKLETLDIPTRLTN